MDAGDHIPAARESPRVHEIQSYRHDFRHYCLRWCVSGGDRRRFAVVQAAEVQALLEWS
jgi:hypothetical protein